MAIKISDFEIEFTGRTLYLRIPRVGAAFLGDGLSVWESWGAVKRAEARRTA